MKPTVHVKELIKRVLIQRLTLASNAFGFSVSDIEIIAYRNHYLEGKPRHSVKYAFLQDGVYGEHETVIDDQELVQAD